MLSVPYLGNFGVKHRVEKNYMGLPGDFCHGNNYRCVLGGGLGDALRLSRG